MKKVVAILTALVIVLAMFIVPSFAEEITIDFNTEEGRAAGSFFGSECEYKEDAGTEGKTVAYLVNKNNGADATEDNGGVYNNGLIITFDAAQDSEAEVTLTLICPDHINGAAGYKLYYLFGDDTSKIEMADLSAVENHSFFTYTITGDVVKGSNHLYLVQAVGSGTGNGWRIDVAKAEIKLTAKEAEPAVKVSEDGLTKTVNFNALDNTNRVKGALSAEAIGAIDIDNNYQIGFNDDQSVLMTIDGYDPTWVIYKVEAPAGKTLETLKLTITGRIYDYAPNANAFAVFAKAEPFSGSGSDCELNSIEAQNRGANDWEDYCVYHAQANVADAKGVFATEHGIDTVHELDLSEVAKDQSVIYVAIFQLTTGSPEWIEYKNLTLAATAKDAETAPDTTDTPATTDAPDTEDNVQTGDATVAMFAVIAVLAIGAAVVFMKKRTF